jgi:glutaconate CoA-transferase subunit B
VPRVILFREEHSRRTLVEKVDFISAPGTSPGNVYRPGGPKALVTGRCVFSFNGSRFRLESVHPDHSVEEVVENTGFDFDCPDDVTETPQPDPRRLELLRREIAPRVAEFYPDFAARVFGVSTQVQGTS